MTQQELERAAARYGVLRLNTIPRELYDHLASHTKMPAWTNLREGQAISEKIDELCDAALAVAAAPPMNQRPCDCTNNNCNRENEMQPDMYCRLINAWLYKQQEQKP